MENCLASGNLQAHYVRGIQQYFHHQNINGGLLHLQIAAEGSYEKAVYLYGVIMLAKGETAIGQAILDTLGWRQSKNRADRCWRRVKRSLHGIRVTRLESYMTAYRNTRETIACHRDNIHERFIILGHYRLLKENEIRFYFFVKALEYKQNSSCYYSFDVCFNRTNLIQTLPNFSSFINHQKRTEEYLSLNVYSTFKNEVNSTQTNNSKTWLHQKHKNYNKIQPPARQACH
ncbi:hypothetical protein YC2023_033684 [Brassica napus]